METEVESLAHAEVVSASSSPSMGYVLDRVGVIDRDGRGL